MTSIKIEVADLPPAKSQSSVFGVRSKHHRRALDLLEAAHRVKSSVGFKGFGSSPIRLEVEVRAPAGGPPGDPTNYLGGIADVLEVKKRRIKASGSLEYLGYRIHVGLYDDDRQLKEIHYREVERDELSYVITLSAIQ